MDRMNDFVVVVTGASTGLGRAIAEGVAGRGAGTVILNYASNDHEAEVTAGLVRTKGAQAVLVKGDVRSDEDCRRIAGSAADHGRIDVLFNNAAVTKVAAHDDLDAVNATDFRDMYEVNVVGAYQMIRAARTLLESAEQPGAVVNTASIAGVLGVGSSVPYAASKAALILMTKSLARALAPKIRINAICPGFIDTPWFEKNMTDEQIAQLRAIIRDFTPLQVASTAEDIAGSAIFLGSPASRHVTGESLIVDAGTHLQTGVRRPS